MYISVESDITEASRLLKGFDKERPNVRKNLLRMSAQKTRSKVKKSFTSYLHKRSGNLYKSVRYSLYRNKRAAVVTAHNKEDNYRYGFALAHGYDVTPKNAKTLTFQRDGKWYRLHEAHVNARDWVEEPGNRYLNSGEYRNDLNVKMEKEVERIEKKYSKAD